MKRLIFILIAFTCTMFASIAADIGARSTDMLQKEFVISQITPMPIMNAVTFEMANTIYPTAGVYLVTAKADVKLMTFIPDTWRNPDYGPSLLYSNVISITNKTNDYKYSYTPYLQHNYRYVNRSTQNIRSTTRHVFFS